MSYNYSLSCTIQRRPYSQDINECPELRECSECGKEKSRDEFPIHIMGIGGVLTKCKKYLNRNGRKLTAEKRKKKKAYRVQ